MKPSFVLLVWVLSIVVVMTELSERVDGILVVLHRGRVGRLHTSTEKNNMLKKGQRNHSRNGIKKRFKRPHHRRIPKSVKVGFDCSSFKSIIVECFAYKLGQKGIELKLSQCCCKKDVSKKNIFSTSKNKMTIQSRVCKLTHPHVPDAPALQENSHTPRFSNINIQWTMYILLEQHKGSS
jgi:hypothetical protein